MANTFPFRALQARYDTAGEEAAAMRASLYAQRPIKIRPRGSIGSAEIFAEGTAHTTCTTK
jgi:hypothetical protein